MKKLLGIGLLLIVMLMLACSVVILHATQHFLYSNTRDIPHNETGIVLGTSKYTKDGERNQFYTKRLHAAKKLYDAGKINYLIVSGDNRAANYNEPEAMRRDLIDLGIPPQKIYADYAGFRTLDSMVRAKYIFGQQKFTVISQKFHNQRAIFIARNKDLHVIGFNASDVTTRYGIRVIARELFARVKVFYDLYTESEPHFYGDAVSIQ